MTDLTTRPSIAETMRSNWGWLLGLGIVFILAGVFAFAMPLASTLAVTIVVAIALIVAGVVQIIQAWRMRSWGDFAWQLLIGIVILVGGIAIYLNPVAGTLALTLIAGAAFIASAARLKLAPGDALYGRLAGIVGLFTVDEQRRILLTLAEAAALAGHVDMARFAATRAQAICPPGSVDSARAKLYEAAAVILTDDYDHGLALLEAIATAPLPDGDARLRQAVLAVARQVRPAHEAVASASPMPR